MSKTLLFLGRLNNTPQGVVKAVGPTQRQFRHADLELTQVLTSAGFLVYFTGIEHVANDGRITRAFTLDGIKEDALHFLPAKEDVVPDIIINRRKDELYNHPAYD